MEDGSHVPPGAQPPGVETHRRWLDRAIARTTIFPLGLFSVVALLATRLGHPAPLRLSAHGLAPQKAPDLLRHPGATPDLGRAVFTHVPALGQNRETLRPAFWDGISYALRYVA